MRRRLALLLGVLGMVLTPPGALEGAGDPFATLAVARLTHPGDPQEFTASAPDGGSVTASDYRGRVVFLNFWATWCPPCREEMPRMERLYGQYRDRGLVVLALSVDAGGESSVVSFLREGGFTFPVGLDPAGRIATLYGVRALPSTLLLDRQGRLVAKAIGPRDWDSPEAFAVIEQLLAEP